MMRPTQVCSRLTKSRKPDRQILPLALSCLRDQRRRPHDIAILLLFLGSEMSQGNDSERPGLTQPLNTDHARYRPHIRFEAPATLKKWPSIKNERLSAADGARPYSIVDGTLDDCIRQFMAKPVSQHHLYEIHTAPQGELIGAVLSAEHILEIARLRDFL